MLTDLWISHPQIGVHRMEQDTHAPNQHKAKQILTDPHKKQNAC